MSTAFHPRAAEREAQLDALISRFLDDRAAGRSGIPCSWSAGFDELGFGPREVLELVAGLEDALGVRLANEDLGPASLRSAGSLRELFAGRLAGAEARRKKRFALLTSEFLPHLSGPQRAICDLHEQLRPWLDFEVYTFDLGRGLAAREVTRGIPVTRFAVPRATDLLRLRRRFRLVAQAGLRAEEVCRYDLPSTSLFADLRRADPDGIVSFFYSGILAQEVMDFFPSREWLLIPFFFQAPRGREGDASWWDLRRVDKLLLFQERDWQAAFDHGVPAEKLGRLPFPVDTDRFRPSGATRDPDTLLYVGRLTANKGIRAFLETFRWMRSKRPSLRLRLVADLASPSPVEQRERERLQAAVRGLGLAPHVEFAGRKEGEALVEEYSRHQIHVLPSIGDCYSFVTMEALACGMTCVNLDNPAYDWQRRRDGGHPLVHLCPTLPAMGQTILRLLERGGGIDHRDYMVANLSWSRWRDEYRRFFLG